MTAHYEVTFDQNLVQKPDLSTREGELAYRDFGSE